MTTMANCMAFQKLLQQWFNFKGSRNRAAQFPINHENPPHDLAIL
jgi:hypothetical protein